MVYQNRKRIAKISVIVLQVTAVLVMACNAVYADAPASFDAKIRELSNNSITVRVMDKKLSKWTPGQTLTVRIIKGTRVFTSQYKAIKLSDLSVGTMINIIPTSVPGEVQADTITILGRRK
jgi:hypothetical protein